MATAAPFIPRLVPHISTPRVVSVDMEYTSDHVPSSDGHHEEHDGGLDMDIMHDFGEGVGVDMRDFPSHSEDDEVGGIVGTLNQVAVPTHPNPSHLTPSATPTVQGRLTPHPPSSVTPNGEHALSNPGVDIDDMFKAETGLDDDDDDENDDPEATPSAKRTRPNPDVPGGFTYVDKDGEPGRRKIRIEYIADKSRRHITFSKRKAGIMKKAYELSILTGTQVLLLVVSETGLVYTFTTTKLQPLVQKAEGKNLIQACLNAPDGFGPDGQPLGGPVPATKAKNGGLAIRPHKLTASASAALAASAQAASMNQNGGGNDHDHAQHAQNQADAAAAIGQGTPVQARPKKRMPSGKGKKAQTAASEMQNGGSSELIPPVPSIPDIHRQQQNSPHSASIMPPTLASPLSGGYHIPSEYHHHPSPTTPSFGYAGGPPGDYQQGYYAPPHGHGHPHGAYLAVGPGGHMYQQDGRDRRMMIDEHGRSIGMGM